MHSSLPFKVNYLALGKVPNLPTGVPRPIAPINILPKTEYFFVEWPDAGKNLSLRQQTTSRYGNYLTLFVHGQVT
jgi:hypothetical protein